METKFRKYFCVCGSCGEDEEGNGVQESTDKIGRREKTNWKTQRDVEMQELKKVGRG
jgi:hypothetical protein